ncbi:putative 3-oxoacyl-[acyl-carrier-protein] synthase [Podosphaera aphanis]|nr:putative 3-oxoacyl-[acyl-carrier-protein] synthase [Podosphaera aphanis]
MRRVVVTGIGAITPLGVGIRHAWPRLVEGACGVVSVANHQPNEIWQHVQSQVAGLVSEGCQTKAGWMASHWLDKRDELRMPKFNQFAVAASEMALEDSGWRPEKQEDKERTGVCLGSGIGNMDGFYNTCLLFEQKGYKKVSPLFVTQLLINLAAGHISIKYGLEGPNHAVTTACSSGAHSIGDASRFIAFDDADVMLAGGSESCIHPLAFASFSRTRSLSTTYNHDAPSACRPFDQDRCGFVLAEGAGVVVLEELEHAKARGANIYAEIRGYGCSGDASHVTAPRADGRGAFLAMKKALKNARLKPRDVDYINAHATGTSLGDAAENAAISRLMLGEDGVEYEGEICVSSTKGATGHALGAAGAIEAIFTILAVQKNVMPPTLNLYKIPDGFNCNYVPRYAQQKTINVALSNSFGFGGTNASLVFSKYE